MQNQSHKWTGQQVGGHPADATSTEWIEFCEVCGIENQGSGVIQEDCIVAHKVVEGGQVLVDWETGDPEGDRKHLFTAYRDFLKEIKACTSQREIIATFARWKVADLNIDSFPRINIERPVPSKM